jgi:SAM-dependent methyltransferase
VTKPSAPLVGRYRADDLSLFSGPERDRFLGPHGADGMLALSGDESAWRRIAPHVVWEVLYRKEPDLYERLIAGERVHPHVLGWLPEHIDRCVELAAGSGRLTLDLAPRCGRLVAVEPAKPLRRKLEANVRRMRNVEIRHGFFDDVPVEDDWADVVVSLSAFTPEEARGGETGLAEMERIARPGGLIVLVWPCDPAWLRARGFEYVAFEGEMAVEFASVSEAVAVARIFYPDAVDEIKRRASPVVPYGVLGTNPPCDLAWKRVP